MTSLPVSPIWFYCHHTHHQHCFSVMCSLWHPPPDSPALPIWPPHPTLPPSIIMLWSLPLTCSILASHSLLRASSAIKAWCFSHFLCSFWASSRAVSRAISIFSSTRCPNHSARGDKNSHHQEPNARASPSFPLSHRTSCLSRRKSHPLCSAGAWVPVLSPPTPTPTRHPFLEKKNQDKQLSSSGSNGSTQALPLGRPWVLMPYYFMGLAVLMLQCLLASLREGKNNQRNRGNAPMTTLAKNDTHIQDSLQVVGYLLPPNVDYNPALSEGVDVA